MVRVVSLKMRLSDRLSVVALPGPVSVYSVAPVAAGSVSLTATPRRQVRAAMAGVEARRALAAVHAEVPGVGEGMVAEAERGVDAGGGADRAAVQDQPPAPRPSWSTSAACTR